MPDAYNDACATRQHESPWVWRENHWELEDSATNNCTCGQYAGYKLSGQAPPADVGDIDMGPMDETMTAWLRSHGYTETATVQAGANEAPAPKQCGCGEGQQKNCAVMYYHEGALMHIAVFDTQFCDWGGKLSGTGPIVRFQHPGDYARYFGDDSVRNMQMKFWCKTGESTYISDVAIRDGLRQGAGASSGNSSGNSSGTSSGDSSGSNPGTNSANNSLNKGSSTLKKVAIVIGAVVLGGLLLLLS